MSTNAVLLAAGLTLFAGLATAIGGMVAFYSRRTNTRFLAISWFRRGHDLCIHDRDLGQGQEHPHGQPGEKSGSWAALAFFGGMIFIAIIDKFIPSFEESPGATQTVSQARESGAVGPNAYTRKLLRMGLFTALAVGIHNFPEGLITFFSTLRDPVLGLSIAAAVAIHNIPEGIAVAVPIFYATGSRKQAFFWAFLSGVAEPVGALLGYLALSHFLNETVYGAIFAAVAGIMVYISFDQLLPASREYGDHHQSMLGLFSGMALMALSLLLFI